MSWNQSWLFGGGASGRRAQHSHSIVRGGATYALGAAERTQPRFPGDTLADPVHYRVYRNGIEVASIWEKGPFAPEGTQVGLSKIRWAGPQATGYPRNPAAALFHDFSTKHKTAEKALPVVAQRVERILSWRRKLAEGKVTPTGSKSGRGNANRLTLARRRRMPASQFALPKSKMTAKSRAKLPSGVKGAYPMDNSGRCKDARSRAVGELNKGNLSAREAQVIFDRTQSHCGLEPKVLACEPGKTRKGRCKSVPPKRRKYKR